MTDVDFVIPVYNEEVDLPHSIEKLIKFLLDSDRIIDFSWRIIIVDNGSTDQTLTVANTLALTYTSVSVISLPEKGRGRALKAAWTSSDSKILAYMDVDLSTSLSHIVDLTNSIYKELRKLKSGRDVPFGSCPKEVWEMICAAAVDEDDSDDDADDAAAADDDDNDDSLM